MNYLLQYQFPDETVWHTWSYYADVDRAMNDYKARRDYDTEHGIVRTWRVEFRQPTGAVAEMLAFRKDYNTNIWNMTD